VVEPVDPIIGEGRSEVGVHPLLKGTRREGRTAARRRRLRRGNAGRPAAGRLETSAATRTTARRNQRYNHDNPSALLENHHRPPFSVGSSIGGSKRNLDNHGPPSLAFAFKFRPATTMLTSDGTNRYDGGGDG
jgi:hypothetical protein